jgi:hypothetical protein
MFVSSCGASVKAAPSIKTKRPPSETPVANVPMSIWVLYDAEIEPSESRLWIVVVPATRSRRKTSYA